MARPSQGKTPAHVRRTNEARNAAIRRLIEAFPNEWQAFYAEEALARGVNPRSANREQRIAKLRAELADLEMQSA